MYTPATVKDNTYYEKRETWSRDLENYYGSGKQKALGVFLGSACKEKGIIGDIMPNDFQKLIAGIHPQTGEKLFTQKKTKWDATDGTFSVPKDVSLLYFLSTPEEQKKIANAFTIAVNRIVARHEKLAQRRIDNKNNMVRDCKLYIARFDHETARSVSDDRRPDPQLHAHLPVLRHVLNAKNEDKILDNHFMFDNKTLFGAEGRAELATELRKLGYGILPHKERLPEDDNEHAAKKGRGKYTYVASFKIDGISSEMREYFSGRSEQINKIAQERGETSARAKSLITVECRKVKDLWDRDQLIQIWKDEAKEFFNFDQDTAISLKKFDQSVILKSARTDEYIIRSALDKNGILWEGNLKRKLAEYEQYTGINYEANFQRLQNEGKIERLNGYKFEVKCDLTEVFQRQREYRVRTRANPKRHISLLVELADAMSKMKPAPQFNFVRFMAFYNIVFGKQPKKWKPVQPVKRKAKKPIDYGAMEIAKNAIFSGLLALKKELGACQAKLSTPMSDEAYHALLAKIEELKWKIIEEEKKLINSDINESNKQKLKP